jgi:hypothetical protein
MGSRQMTVQLHIINTNTWSKDIYMVHQDCDSGLIASMKSTHVVRHAVRYIKAMIKLIYINDSYTSGQKTFV